jgi:serine protease inhibitor
MYTILSGLPHNENVVLSPFSLISCMAMLCRGATKGPARDQLAYYCWPCFADGAACDDSVALTALSTFVNQLKGVEACKYANILMTDHANVEEYKGDISRHFNTKPRHPNEFALVNEEVQEITTIPKTVLDREPKGTVLINAVYFADQWTYKFDEDLTSEPFKQATGDRIHVDMMHQKNKLNIAQFDSVTAVHLEYKTPGIGAWFVKHDRDHTHAAAYDALQRFVQRVFVHKFPTTYEHVELTVPKFEMDSSIDLLTLFSAESTTPRITHVFSPGHLSRMSTYGNEAVSRFDQECILKVDQKGTVAAAKTVLAMTRGGGGRPSYQDISFAHTFYMVIHHNDTILFVAKVASPTPSPPAAQLVLPPAQAPLQSPEVTIKMTVKKIMPRTLRVEVRQHVETTATSEYTVPSHFDTTDETTIPIRVYEVQPKTEDNEQLIRVIVTLKGEPDEPNDTFITLWVIYITEYGEDDTENPEKELISLKINDPYELPFPIQKYEGEGEDGWDLRDEKDNTFLKIRFRVPDS